MEVSPGSDITVLIARNEVAGAVLVLCSGAATELLLVFLLTAVDDVGKWTMAHSHAVSSSSSLSSDSSLWGKAFPLHLPGCTQT